MDGENVKNLGSDEDRIRYLFQIAPSHLPCHFDMKTGMNQTPEGRNRRLPQRLDRESQTLLNTSPQNWL